MRSLHLLVSNALVVHDFAPVLLRDLKLHSLDQLAAHFSEEPSPRLDPDLATWQAWLLRSRSRANIAEVFAQAYGRPVGSGRLPWLLEPVHFQVATDHLELEDPGLLNLDKEEAEILAEAARPILEQAGWMLDATIPQHWLGLRPHPLDLSGPSIERAIGGNVGFLLPKDQGSGAAKHWGRVANEIQMVWHALELNQIRERQGRPTINGLWLSGNGEGGSDFRHLHEYAHIVSGLPLLRQFASHPSKREIDPAMSLRTWDGLITPARQRDWSNWRNSVQALDLYVADVIEDLRKGRIEELLLVLCGEHHVRVGRVRRNDLWKIWRRGRAAELFSDVA